MVVQILAHVSAPTTRQGDEMFRKQAQTYLSFKTGQRVNILDVTERQREPGLEAVTSRSSGSSSPKQPILIAGNRSQKRRMSPDETSTRISCRSKGGSRLPSQRSGGRVSSSFARSAADCSMVSHKRRRTSTSLHPNRVDLPSKAPRLTMVKGTEISASSEPHPLQAQDANETIHNDQISNTKNDYANIPPTTSSIAPSALHLATSPVHPALSTGEEMDKTDGIRPDRSSSPNFDAKGGPHEKSSQDRNRVPVDFSALPMEYHPPRMTTNTAKGSFPSQVTETLHLLTSNPDVGKKYRPRSVVRDLRASERGHWRVNTSHWPPDLQQEFWNYLGMLIERGRLGWGVWCSRDPAGAEELGMVRVFCWGEVVEHVYLLLYVGSKAKIRTGGACWLDGSGMVVVEMP